MRRYLMVALVAAAACTKKTDPLPPMPPDPPPKPEAEKVAEPPPKPAEPPPKPQPVDASLAAPKVTVKLVSPGKGKRAPLKVTPKAGAKQAIELALDFGQRAEQGTNKEADPILTFVFAGDAEVKDVDKDGAATYGVVVTDVDARAVGATVSADKLAALKQDLAVLKGLVIGGAIAANGSGSELKLHLDAAGDKGRAALELLQLALPTWPVLPVEPIAVGAKWQVVAVTKMVQTPIEVTHTTEYELVAHKGDAWTIKGTTKVTGTDQSFGPAQVSKIGGTGTIEVAVVDGALYPTMKTTLSTEFVAAKTGEQPAKITFLQATQVTPK